MVMSGLICEVVGGAIQKVPPSADQDCEQFGLTILQTISAEKLGKLQD